MLRTVYRRTNAVIKTGGGRSGPGVALEFAAVVRSPGTMRASGVAQAFGAVVRSRINDPARYPGNKFCKSWRFIPALSSAPELHWTLVIDPRKR